MTCGPRQFHPRIKERSGFGAGGVTKAMRAASGLATEPEMTIASSSSAITIKRSPALITVFIGGLSTGRPFCGRMPITAESSWASRHSANFRLLSCGSSLK